MALQLLIGNKNYSSWSMRPWVLMRQLGIAFEERKLRFDFSEGSAFRQAVAKVSPAGFVPVLVAREILLRGEFVARGRMLNFLLVCVVLAISASYAVVFVVGVLAMALSMLCNCAVVVPRCTLVLSALAALAPPALGFVVAPRADDSPALGGSKGLLVLSIFMGYSLFLGSIATYIGHFR